jgi:hypothetical protein
MASTQAVHRRRRLIELQTRACPRLYQDIQI